MKRKIVGLLTKFWPLASVVLLVVVIPASARAELVGYWDFDEGSGATVSDSAGSNPGTLKGSTTFTTGKFGQALSFDGLNSYVDLGASRFGLQNEISIAFWIYPKGSNGKFYQGIIQRDPYLRPFSVRLQGSNVVDSGFRVTGDTSYKNVTQSLPNDQWSHVVVTYKNGSRVIYINSQPVLTDNLSGDLNWLYDSTSRTIVGMIPWSSGDNAYPLKANLDDLRIYSQSLSATEVQSLYNSTPSAPSNPTPPPTSCTPNWSCTAWATCSSSGNQTRTCSDSNACGVDTDKPATNQSCTYVPPKSGNRVDLLGNNKVLVSTFTTIQACADVAVAGQTCLVYPGIYRESVVPKNSGTAGNPIIYRSLNEREAILDGSEPLIGWKKCSSQAECGGNPNWNNIYYTDSLPDGTSPFTANLHEGDEFLSIAQYPEQPDPIFNKNLDLFTSTTKSNIQVKQKLSTPPTSGLQDYEGYLVGENATGAWAGKTNNIAYWRGGNYNQWSFERLAEGNVLYREDTNKVYVYQSGQWILDTANRPIMTRNFIKDPRIFDKISPSDVPNISMVLWTLPNVVQVKQGFSYDSSTGRINFNTPLGFTNTPAGYDKYSLYNHVRLIDKAGKYSIDQNGRVYLWPNSSVSNITYSTRTVGFDVSSRNYLTIDGFVFKKISGDKLTGGLAVGTVKTNAGIYGIEVRNNEITHNRYVGRGYGGVYLYKAQNCTVEDNYFHDNFDQMAIFIAGNASNVYASGNLVSNNTIIRQGQIPIWFMGVKDSQIVGNYIKDSRGVHSNAITIYEYSKNNSVLNNTVINSQFSFAYNNIYNTVVAGNLFVDTKDGGRVIANGYDIQNVEIHHNTLIGVIDGQHDDSHGYNVHDNIIKGFAPKAGETIKNNLYFSPIWNQTSLGEKGIYEPDLTKIFVNPSSGNYTLRCQNVGVSWKGGPANTANPCTMSTTGGSIGSGSGVSTNPIPPSSCTPTWSCSSWSTCSTSNTQTRTCNDIKACGVSTGKPALTQSCTYTSPTTGVVTPPTTSTGGSSSSHSGGGGGGGSSSNTKSNNPAPVTTVTVTETLPKLVGPFAPGMRTEQVKVLQQYLSRDSSIYPEAIVDGYYSDSVTKAVQRFQSKYGLVSSGDPYTTAYGLAGPATRAKITEVLGVANSTTDSAKAATIAALKKQITELITLLISMLQAQMKVSG